MNAAQIQEFKQAFQNEFVGIYQLCYVLIQSTVQNPVNLNLPLIKACLNALNAFLHWVSLEYLFKTDLVVLLLQLFDSQDLQLTCLKIIIEILCLPEISELERNGNQEIKQKIVSLYSIFMEKLNNYVAPDTNLAQHRSQLMKQKNPTLGYFNSFSKV